MVEACHKELDRRWLAALSLTALGFTLLRLLPSDRFTFLPPCPVHTLTGLLCPGCGATHALAALSHGHLALALHENALAVLLLPVLFLAALLRPARLPQPAFTALLAVTALFTLLRNLP